MRPLLYFFSASLLCCCLNLESQAQAGDNNIPPIQKRKTPAQDLITWLHPTGPGHEAVEFTFKSSRVLNGQSVENLEAGKLDFIILHRFGAVNQGLRDFFGLDNAVTRIGFEYGLTNWIALGIGRSTYQKEFDGYTRIKILQQTTDNHMPITLSYAGTLMLRSDDISSPDTSTPYFFSNRMSFCNQLLIARKFGDRFSLQLSPTQVHYNLVRDPEDANDLFALGIGGRLKLNELFALTAEYFYTLPGANLKGYQNSASIGIDITTGGHVFQLQFSNSTGLSERSFIGQTTDSWSDGGIHFGFNLHRVFTVVKPKEFQG
ncbi:MAG: hypothetical protein JST06_05600 [Bacteroidetes bacterium]|nr:hypothetical protein [Bacteroidota bacterium]